MLKGTTKKPKWSSSKKSVATVTSKGKIKAKKKGNAVITAKLGKKNYKCKVKVKAKSAATTTAPQKSPSTVVPTVTPTETPAVTTVADNYQKLAKHIQKNGEYDSEDGYYYIDDIYFLDGGNVYMQFRYNLDGSFDFVVMQTLDAASDTAAMMVLSITPPEYSEGEAMEILVLGNTNYYAMGIVDISALSQTNTRITYTYTNALTTSLKDSLYELGEIDLALGLAGWSLLLKTSGSDLTLKDLGFTSYEI
ncbi:MAG: Ig-like domain-containing protein [Ruminococcus flavefaciens]|nr:Ig-like domain-containing protein [Ruminococcus flavefaciens]